MNNYLASVVVYNQLDYSDDEIKSFEETIQYILNQYLMPGVEIKEDNIVFSYPQDPSVKSASIPVLVDITLLRAADKIRGSSNDIATSVRNVLTSKNEGAREIVVIVRFPANLVGYAPRG